MGKCTLPDECNVISIMILSIPLEGHMIVDYKGTFSRIKEPFFEQHAPLLTSISVVCNWLFVTNVIIVVQDQWTKGVAMIQ